MKINIYKVSDERIEIIENREIFQILQDPSHIYVVELEAKDRHEASEELLKLDISQEICGNLLEPTEHIRFEYFGETLYGEVAYFSPTSKKSDYAGIIIHKNILIGVHPANEGIINGLLKTKNLFTEKQKENISPEFILYILIHEILSRYGKLILTHRETIEALAIELDKDDSKVSPKDFLESKSQLSIFSRTLEELVFTLNFPPATDILETDSPYRSTFDYLLKSLDFIVTSLKQTEERLESLNDHYQLLLQSKGNKRLSFLTIIQSIFVPLTLLVGIYGMNFDNMPELHYKYGYFISLGVMITIALGFIWYFKKHGWFD